MEEGPGNIHPGDIHPYTEATTYILTLLAQQQTIDIEGDPQNGNQIIRI